MDHNFTNLLKEWLDASDQERDYTVGALYLLQLTGNQILYKNLIANLEASKSHIEHQLQKHFDFRVLDLTHEQVYEMEIQVKTIVEEHIPLAAKADEQPKGRRPDHDPPPTRSVHASPRTYPSFSACANSTCDYEPSPTKPPPAPTPTASPSSRK